MSITRLQQARQMYAMGKRVGRIAFGGGGSQGDGGYQGGQNESDKATGGQGGSSGTGTDNRGSTGGSNDNPFSSGYQGAVNQTKTATPMDVKEQYAVGNDITLGAPIAPTFMSPQLETNRHNNYLDALNLAGSTYKPLNIPPFVPGGMLLNTVGNFIGGIGAKKNRQFFADNVAGKYGFGYGMDAYKDYMSRRMAGEVGAYGNENMGQNAIDARAKDGGGGIMDVYTNNTTDDTTDDTTTEDELLLRFLGEDSTLDPAAAGVANTDELRAMILERAKNLYT
jgi:hypothetical protein